MGGENIFYIFFHDERKQQRTVLLAVVVIKPSIEIIDISYRFLLLLMSQKYLYSLLLQT